MTEHPIRKYLQDRIDMPSRYRSIIEAPLLEHGRPFAGIARPKGYHLKPTKNCFMNAMRLATNDFDVRGTYVEGYAMAPSGWPVHHAWVTLERGGYDLAVCGRGVSLLRHSLCRRCINTVYYSP
jgi:hypothetical protein